MIYMIAHEENGCRTWNPVKNGVVYKGLSGKPKWGIIYLHARFKSMHGGGKHLDPRTVDVLPPYTWIPVKYFHTADEGEFYG